MKLNCDSGKKKQAQSAQNMSNNNQCAVDPVQNMVKKHIKKQHITATALMMEVEIIEHPKMKVLEQTCMILGKLRMRFFKLTR